MEQLNRARHTGGTTRRLPFATTTQCFPKGTHLRQTCTSARRNLSSDTEAEQAAWGDRHRCQRPGPLCPATVPGEAPSPTTRSCLTTKGTPCLCPRYTSANVLLLILWLGWKLLVAWITSASLQRRLAPEQLRGLACLGTEVLKF